MNSIMRKTRALFSPPPAPPNKDLAVRLIGDAWITFVTKTLTTADALGHPDIAEELCLLEESGSLEALRSEQHHEIIRIITELLNSTPKARNALCRQTDVKMLALALDRVQSITFKFVEFGRPDRDAPLYVVQPLLELFHGMLLEDPGAATSP